MEIDSSSIERAQGRGRVAADVDLPDVVGELGSIGERVAGADPIGELGRRPQQVGTAIGLLPRHASGRSVAEIVEAQERGAGEIVLNCMNQDGVRKGYDIRQLQQIRAMCSVPLIASGGAGAR